DRLLTGATVTPLLKELPKPTFSATHRVRARLRKPAPSRAWVGGLVLAAGALLVLGSTQLPQDPAPLAQALASAGQAEITPDLQATWQGSGRITGTEEAPIVDWDKGSLHLELTPDQGVDLQVRTREASVLVLGTVFDVDRDVLGTTVSVTRGSVQVNCTQGPNPTLNAGEQHTCLPVSAAASASRLQSLQDQASQTRRDEIARAMNLDDAEGDVLSELLALRLELNAQDQDWSAVQRDALAYLEIGGPRALEIRTLAAQLQQREGDCAGVRTLLSSVDNLSDREQAVLNACE
ncbi:MAG: hypothetical protein ACI9VR_003938, partial [Cognaticolwellia sp.]